MANFPILRPPPGAMILPDNDQWRFRFQVRSESSGRIYIVSQNINRKHWGCSCPGWKRHRTCKHLESMGLPGREKPFEVTFVKK